MRIPRVYTSNALSGQQSVALEGQTAHYLSKVLRMDAGRELVLFNGDGSQYCATITHINKKNVTCDITDSTSQVTESPLYTELAIGVSRGERMDWALQKATELGVTAITPLFTERTEVRLKGERLEKKMGHWQQILISACEQCGRNTLPKLNPAQNIEDFIRSDESDTLKLVLHHRSEKNIREYEKPRELSLLIGPEGGLSEEEIKLALRNNFNALTLGPRVMRTETAPIAALAIAQQLWGDF